MYGPKAHLVFGPLPRTKPLAFLLLLLLAGEFNKGEKMKAFLFGFLATVALASPQNGFQLGGFPQFPGGHGGGGPIAGCSEFVTRQYAAQMSLASQLKGLDGFPARRIFANEYFREGDALVLDQVSGVSIGRIKSGKAKIVELCPQNWRVNFVDRFGNLLGCEDRLESYYRRPVRIPRGAVAAYIGYEDTAYFDNEGKRWAKSGSTNGCTFQFRILR
jgi:hypothetical protein